MLPKSLNTTSKTKIAWYNNANNYYNPNLITNTPSISGLKRLSMIN